MGVLEDVNRDLALTATNLETFLEIFMASIHHKLGSHNDSGFMDFFHGLLIIGGIAERVDFAFEEIDDLQLAVLSALETSDASTVTIEVGNMRNASDAARMMSSVASNAGRVISTCGDQLPSF